MTDDKNLPPVNNIKEKECPYCHKNTLYFLYTKDSNDYYDYNVYECRSCKEIVFTCISKILPQKEFEKYLKMAMANACGPAEGELFRVEKRSTKR